MENKALKVVKVVNLKRFMPETPAQHQSIITSKVRCKKTNIHTSDIFFKNNFDVSMESHSVDSRSMAYENQETERKTDEINVSESHKYFNTDISKIDSFKSKVKFRNCSHRKEELSKLTEHCDESLVKIGDTFDSREAFRKYIYDKAKSWFYYYVCRNSKERIMEYSCICTAYNVKPREVIIRKQRQRTTACPCKIRLTSDHGTKKVTVYYVCNHHDHALTEEAFQQYPHAKHLPQNIKEEFLDLVYLRVDVHLIQKYIQSVVGVRIKKKDIGSYAYKIKKNFFQRTLTADRKKYLNHLISSIRSTYNATFSMTLNEKSAGVCKVQSEKDINKREAKVEKSQINPKKINNGEIVSKEDEIIITNSELGGSLLDHLLGTDLDLDNAQVIVQYVNEKGILCDENGTPITNSSAIMHFINNYENVTPESDLKEEIYSQEHAFGALVENIDEEIYRSDWESMHEMNPLFEKTSVTCKGDAYAENEETLISDSDEFAQELLVQTTEGEHVQESGFDRDKSVNIPSPDKRLSPDINKPGTYAEIEIFKKYYFVDHRYIKYDGGGTERDQRSTDGKGRTLEIGVNGKESCQESTSEVCRAQFRHCTGHEHLTLLRDPGAISPGAKFVTHGVFLDYINERASRWYFYYSLLESGKSPEYYVYKCVYGQQRLARSAYRAKGLRKRSNLERTQCPCLIRLRRLETDPSCLTVVYSCNHHDHALDSERFEAQPHSRRLPQHVKEEIKDLLCLGVTYDVLRKHIKAETGHRIYEKYFHNVKVKMRRSNQHRRFTSEELAVLSNKINELQSLYGNESKAQGRKARKRKIESSMNLTSDAAIQVGYTTQTIEHLEMQKIDDFAEEVCIAQEDSCAPDVRMCSQRSRLETRLQYMSSQEETLSNVKTLQEYARSDSLIS